MKLLPDEIATTIPPLYAQEKVEEPTVFARLFNAGGSGTWLVLEYDPKERVAFGYVMGLQQHEYGYFSLDELEAYRGAFRLGIERDLHFRPCPLSEAIKKG